MAKPELHITQPTALHAAVKSAADISSLTTNKFLEWSLRLRAGFLEMVDEDIAQGGSGVISIGDRVLGPHLLSQYSDQPRTRLVLYLPYSQRKPLVAEGERTRGGASLIVSDAAALGVEIYNLRRQQPHLRPFSHLMDGNRVGTQRAVFMM